LAASPTGRFERSPRSGKRARDQIAFVDGVEQFDRTRDLGAGARSGAASGGGRKHESCGESRTRIWP